MGKPALIIIGVDAAIAQIKPIIWIGISTLNVCVLILRGVGWARPT
ncbi:hypothetical protein J0895_18565 [Phormidium pseudopriestleyi FRX01]|uniref:Uncharacterized protein n=1 Tax=Phormidium pseudopriestleyi FRX01 TaxID=1759528 RepID=A0ABS3FV93_9CYAN|nr:hypothetical protein [Phormidium pseudopriestleyi]MBO0351035.1 hypothetical protein [Phormidium pseudopriestleyi FRX01]